MILVAAVIEVSDFEWCLAEVSADQKRNWDLERIYLLIFLYMLSIIEADYY